MIKKVLTTHAPAPVGPYSQGIIGAGPFVFVSGQLGLVPATGKMVTGDVTQEATQVLDNLMAVLKEAGSSPELVVKNTVFLADINDFAAFNAVYATYFIGENPPARSTFQVGKLPFGARVEVESIAKVRP